MNQAIPEARHGLCTGHGVQNRFFNRFCHGFKQGIEVVVRQHFDFEGAAAGKMVAGSKSQKDISAAVVADAAHACQAFVAHAAARGASDPAAREAARAAGHAVATAHMADHELGAAAYAIKAVRLASTASDRLTAGERECRWQREKLPEAIRALVLSDEEQRNKKLWFVFTC